MRPTLINPETGFACFRPFSHPDMDPAMAEIITRLRVIRSGIFPRLFFISGKETRVDIDGVTYFEYANLQLWHIDRRLTPELFIDTMKVTLNVAEHVTNVYERDIQSEKWGKHPPNQTNWLKQQYELWYMSGYGTLDEEPISVTFNPDEYTYSYIDLKLIVPGSGHPDWDIFMSQMDPSLQPVFSAWVWAVLDNRNFGRQIMYLYDKKGSGRTGKSTVMSVLSQSLLEQVAGAMSEDSLKERFGIAGIRNKRLLIIADCQNPSIVKNHKIHSITGADLSLIECKGEMPYSQKVFARVLIGSNYPPTVSLSRGHEVSRMIAIEIDSTRCSSAKHYTADGKYIGDPGFPQRLREQLPSFLHYCSTVYPSICPTHTELLVPDITYQYMQDEEGDLFNRIFAECFEADPKSYVLQSDIARLLSDGGYYKASDVSANLKSKFYTFLTDKGFSEKVARVEGTLARIRKGLKLLKNPKDLSKQKLDNPVPVPSQSTSIGYTGLQGCDSSSQFAFNIDTLPLIN